MAQIFPTWTPTLPGEWAWEGLKVFRKIWWRFNRVVPIVCPQTPNPVGKSPFLIEPRQLGEWGQLLVSIVRYSPTVEDAWILRHATQQTFIIALQKWIIISLDQTRSSHHSLPVWRGRGPRACGPGWSRLWLTSGCGFPLRCVVEMRRPCPSVTSPRAPQGTITSHKWRQFPSFSSVPLLSSHFSPWLQRARFPPPVDFSEGHYKALCQQGPLAGHLFSPLPARASECDPGPCCKRPPTLSGTRTQGSWVPLGSGSQPRLLLLITWGPLIFLMPWLPDHPNLCRWGPGSRPY